MYNVNPQRLIQLIRQGQNPQQLMLSVLEGYAGSPMGKNLLNLARNGQTAEIEKIARNLCKERGVDFDQEFIKFRKTLGI
jgi:transcriptional regulator of met regulon